MRACFFLPFFIVQEQRDELHNAWKNLARPREERSILCGVFARITLCVILRCRAWKKEVERTSGRLESPRNSIGVKLVSGVSIRSNVISVQPPDPIVGLLISI